MKTSEIVRLARNSGYNDDIKNEYRKAAMAWLRAFAKRLNLNKSTYDLRYNPGGIAVAGDATLHHEAFYMTFGESGLMFRRCNGRRDYTGGANRWICMPGNEHFTILETEAVEEIRQYIETAAFIRT